MSGVRGVLNYADCFAEAAGSVARVKGWEAGLRDGLDFVHDPLQFLVVLDRAGAIPSCDITRKNAFYGASVKDGESCSGYAKFPQSCEKVEELMGFINYSASMEGPGQFVADLDLKT